MRDKLCRNTHFSLLSDHAPDGFRVVPGLLAAWLRALPQSVITLGIEEPFFIKSRPLELMVHIGGQNKVVFLLD